MNKPTTPEKEWISISHTCGWKGYAHVTKLKEWFAENLMDSYPFICKRCDELQWLEESCVYDNCNC